MNERSIYWRNKNKKRRQLSLWRKMWKESNLTNLYVVGSALLVLFFSGIYAEERPKPLKRERWYIKRRDIFVPLHTSHAYLSAFDLILLYFSFVAVCLIPLSTSFPLVIEIFLVVSKKPCRDSIHVFIFSILYIWVRGVGEYPWRVPQRTHFRHLLSLSLLHEIYINDNN